MTTAEDLLREAIQSQACRCFICNGPATRELGYNGILYCDDHGPRQPFDEKRFKDLSGAGWIRRVVALLGKPIEEPKGVNRFEREEVL